MKASARASNFCAKSLRNSLPKLFANPSDDVSAAHLLFEGGQRPGEHKPNPSVNSILFPSMRDTNGGPRPHKPAPSFGFCTLSSSSSEDTSDSARPSESCCKLLCRSHSASSSVSDSRVLFTRLASWEHVPTVPEHVTALGPLLATLIPTKGKAADLSRTSSHSTAPSRCTWGHLT